MAKTAKAPIAPLPSPWRAEEETANEITFSDADGNYFGSVVTDKDVTPALRATATLMIAAPALLDELRNVERDQRVMLDELARWQALLELSSADPAQLLATAMGIVEGLREVRRIVHDDRGRTLAAIAKAEGR